MEELAVQIKKALNSGVSHAGIKKVVQKRVVVKRTPKKKQPPLSEERTREVLSPEWQGKVLENMVVLAEGMKTADENSFLQAQYKLLDKRQSEIEDYVANTIQSHQGQEPNTTECRWYTKLMQLHAVDKSFGTSALFLKKAGLQVQRESRAKMKKEVTQQVMAAVSSE